MWDVERGTKTATLCSQFKKGRKKQIQTSSSKNGDGQAGGGGAKQSQGHRADGEVLALAASDDGRYLITLTGVCRYDVVKELRVKTAYRQVNASFDRWQGDLEPPSPSDSMRPTLVRALRSFFEVYEISADWEQIEAAPLAGLITSLAMICPFEPCEKQALLEAAGPEQRGKTLIALLQMGALGSKDMAARH